MSDTTTTAQKAVDSSGQALHQAANSTLHVLSSITFNVADYVILAVILISVVMGIFRGFIKEVLSLLVWVVAIIVALVFTTDLAAVLTPKISSLEVRTYLSFAVLLIGTLLIGALISYLLCGTLKKTGLTFLDRILGFLFGLLRGVVVVTLVLLCLSFSSAAQSSWWHGSSLITYFEPLLHWLKGFIAAA